MNFSYCDVYHAVDGRLPMNHLINHSVVGRPGRSLLDFDNMYGRHTLDRQRKDVPDGTSLTGFFFKCTPWVFHSIIGREGALLTVFSSGCTPWVSLNNR